MYVIILSQYRLKLFQDYRLAIKPCVLFKAKSIADSKAFFSEFEEAVRTLSGSRLQALAESNDYGIMGSAYEYFRDKGITFDQLAQELRDDFGPSHCISANDESEAEERQIALNTLEDPANPYRAIFEVKKLDEGWDVLNLFDIVRLYETRDARNGIPGKGTLSEAQLIGRGARYCPFVVEDGQERFQRKYDHDLDNPLRVCEELYYHCQNSGRYIDELHKALVDTGIESDDSIECFYELKDEFKKDTLYKYGFVFLNERHKKSRANVHSLLPSIKRPYSVSLATGRSGIDLIMEDNTVTDNDAQVYSFARTIRELAQINYAIVFKALCRYPVFKFNVLKERYPNLKSTREFIESDAYLGDIRIELHSKYEEPSNELLFQACTFVLGKIATSILSIKVEYEGTREFIAEPIMGKIKDKRCRYARAVPGGLGVSQNDHTVDPSVRMNLSQEEWFVFNDNFGTNQEKAFVADLKCWLEKLREKYEKVFLVRNERQVAIYSFDGGERFEPDYLVFLQVGMPDEGFEQLQVFVEPKGSHLMAQDAWKEEFLLQIGEEADVIQAADGNRYLIYGFPFFNTENRKEETVGAYEYILLDSRKDD